MFQPPTAFDLIALRTFREGDVSAESGERITVSPLYALILTTKGLASYATKDERPEIVAVVDVPSLIETAARPVRRRGGYRRRDLRADA